MKTKLGCLLTVVALLAGLHQAAAQDTTVFPIATNGAASQAGIFAAFGRTNYLVGIQGDGTTNDTAISAQLISTNGTLVGSRILPGRAGGIPYVAFGGTNFLLLWSDDALVASGGNDQVYGQFVTQSGTLVGSPFTFGPTSEEQDMQGGGGSLLAFDGKNYLAVWDTGGFHDSPGGDIHGALFNQIGSLVVPVIPITSETNGALTPTVAFGKTNYLVVWNNRRSTGPEEYDIYGEFISTNGTQGTAFVISQTPTPSYDPCCAAFDGTNFMVVWSKNIGSASPNTIWNLYGRVVSADGTFPGNEVAIVTDPNNPEVPSLAFDGANYLLAWNVGELSTNSQIVFQFFNPAASSIGSEFYLFSQQRTNRPLAGSVLFDGNHFEITAVVGGSTGTGSEGTDFTSSTGTYGTFFSTNPTASAALGYAYTTNAGGVTLTITGYSGPGEAVAIPGTINNLPVTGIGTNAFYGNTSLTSVLIPNSVTNIGKQVFADCTNLTGVDFQGDAPSADSTAFNGDNYATAYYLSGTTGWSSPFAGIPAVLSIPDSLQVTISPASAIVAGAQWQVDGGTWQNSEATVSNLSVGSHTVSFNAINGWTTPVNHTASVNGTWTSTALGTYNPLQFNYTITNGTITITRYTGSGGAVTIPGTIDNLPVTSIGSDAFLEESVTSVTIPDSATSIGEAAFEDCTSLTSVTVGAGVTNIGNSAFNFCVNLTTVYFEGNPPTLGSGAFGDETNNPMAYYLPGTTGWADFSSSTGLPSEVLYAETTNAGGITIDSYFGPGGAVTIPATLTGLPVASIGDSAFAGTSVTSVTIPDGVTSIGNNAFGGCSYLSSVTIPASVTSIGGSAFYMCFHLTSVTIPNSVTSIGGSAFYNCYSLTSVTIPDSVTNIGDGAFENCIRLTAITVNSGNLFYSSVNGALFNQSQTTLLAFPGALGGIYTIPNGVTSIGDSAFAGTAVTSVAIPNSVTSIGSGAFEACSSLTSVTIPDSVTSIGDYAFYNCDGLTNVTIGNSVTSIGAYAFSGYAYGGDPLSGVTIPNSVTNIGDYAFEQCYSLTSATIGDSVISIGTNAFADCTSLTSVTIPNSVISIGDYAFTACSSLTSVTVPGNVTNFGTVFYGCTKLTNATIDNGATNVGDDAFAQCYSLTSVTIPDSVTSIGDSAFAGTSLTSVTIPDSVTSIGNNPFQGCSSLTAITVDSGNLFYSSVNGALFNQSQTTLLAFPDTLGGSYTIPMGVTNIGGYAFYGCFHLISVTIPNSVTTIGEAAFYDCTSLTSAAIGDGVISIGTSAFADCTSLTGLTIPNSATSIGDYAFYTCYGLTNVTMGNSVTSIGDYAFYDCGHLTSLTMPDSVTSIGDYALAGIGLANVTIGDIVTNIGEGAFADCISLTSVTIPNSVTSIEDYVFDHCTSLRSAAIPNSITNIGDYAFYYCTSLTNVTIGNSVMNIGDYACYNCIGLADVTIGNSVTNIGDYAFCNCISLTNVTMGNSVTNIGGTAFYRCYNLTSVTIPDSVTNIGDGAFYYCDGLTNVTIGNSVISIGTNAFADCTSLTSVTIPNSVTSIGDYAFAGTSLTLVYFEGNAPGVGSTVFNGDPATIYYLRGTTGWNSTFAGVPTMELTAIVFTANPTNGLVPLTVKFTSSGIDSVGGTIANWTWNFGDGSTSTAQNTSHTYIAPGTFSVTLTETNNSGILIAGASASITVAPVQVGIANLSLSGGNLVLNGINGLSGGTYYLLMSTNLTLPLSQWTPVATNVLGADGNFTITTTNTVTHSVPQRFYILEAQ